MLESEPSEFLGLRQPKTEGSNCRRCLHQRSLCGEERQRGRRIPSVSRRHADAHDAHWCAAAAAPQLRPGLLIGRRALDHHPEQIVQQRDRALAVGVQQAEVACAAKALGQDVLKHQREELRTGQGAVFPAVALGVAVAEGHLSVLAREDVLLADDPAVEIAPEVDQRLLAAADVLAVNHPILRVSGRQTQPRRGDGGQQLAAEDFRQCLVAEQVAAFAGAVLAAPLGVPAPAFGVNGRRRHDRMDMRMVIEPTRVGVQHRDGAGRP